MSKRRNSDRDGRHPKSEPVREEGISPAAFRRARASWLSLTETADFRLLLRLAALEGFLPCQSHQSQARLTRSARIDDPLSLKPAAGEPVSRG